MTDMTEVQTGLVLEWVKPSDLGRVWEMIKPGLIKVHKHGTGWLVEDVYLAIKTQHSVLHLGYLNGVYAGFIVTTNEASLQGTIINIWCLYSRMNDTGMLVDAFENVKNWARAIGAVAIRMQSPRPGWKRLAEKFGMRPIATIYEMKMG